MVKRGVNRRAVLAGAGAAATSMATGVRVARDVQVDVSVDHGLNTVEPSWGISAGLVLRHRPR